MIILQHCLDRADSTLAVKQFAGLDHTDVHISLGTIYTGVCMANL